MSFTHFCFVFLFLNAQVTIFAARGLKTKQKRYTKGGIIGVALFVVN